MTDPDGPRTAWVVTDGKAGDEEPCLAIAEALGLAPEIRRVRPRPLFAALAPWGPPDPAERPGRLGGPLAPPYPDLAVASGRRAAPALRALRRASGGRTFTVFLKDPRIEPAAFDLVWAPEHDRLRGPNVVSTLTGPHRLSPTRLEAARAAPDPRIAALPSPRVAVLVGGDGPRHRFAPADAERLATGLAALAAGGASLAITPSRRTPPALRARLRALAAETGAFLWDGEGPNPYVTLLALADAVVATADSINMLGEAVATGAPVHVFAPSGGGPKDAAFLAGLARLGAVRPFAGRLEAFAREPLDATPAIAAAVARAYRERRAARGGGRPPEGTR